MNVSRRRFSPQMRRAAASMFAQGLSVAELGRRTGINVDVLWRIMYGFQKPSRDQVVAITRAIHILDQQEDGPTITEASS